MNVLRLEDYIEDFRNLTHPMEKIRHSALKSLSTSGLEREVVEYMNKIDYASIPSWQHRKCYEHRKWQKAVERGMIKAKREGSTFEHRGIEVYLVNTEVKKLIGKGCEIEKLGFHYEGKPFVNKKVPKKFQDIIAEHELGEYVDHLLGLMMETRYAFKKGVLKEYAKFLGQQFEIEKKALIKGLGFIPEGRGCLAGLLSNMPKLIDEQSRKEKRQFEMLISRLRKEFKGKERAQLLE